MISSSCRENIIQEIKYDFMASLSHEILGDWMGLIVEYYVAYKSIPVARSIHQTTFKLMKATFCSIATYFWPFKENIQEKYCSTWIWFNLGMWPYDIFFKNEGSLMHIALSLLIPIYLMRFQSWWSCWNTMQQWVCWSCLVTACSCFY